MSARPRLSVPAAVLLAVCILVFGSPLAAQDPVIDPAEAYNQAVSAIAGEEWDKGLAVVNGIIQYYGQQGKQSFGAAFGHFFYLRGLLQIGKKNYEGALKSFQTCYEQYPNSKIADREAGQPDTGQPNIFRSAALVQWANVLMHQENYAEAATLYEKALEEGKDDPKVNRIYVTVNLGRCRIKAGDLDGGFGLISPALRNPRASDGLKEVVFLILSEDWSPQVALPPMREFLNEFRSIVSLDEPSERFERNARFRALAQEAFSNNDPIRALAWYSLIVDPASLVADIEEEIAELEAREVATELEDKKIEVLAELRAEKEKLRRQSWHLLNGVASAHFQMQNFSAAHVAFAKLSDEVPDDFPDRPVYLHNAVTAGVRIDEWDRAYHYGSIFLGDHREHELLPSVARVLVELIFLRGEYQKAYDIATDVRSSMDPGSEIRDIPDFVTGASAFHLEKLDVAESELASYLAGYPEGQRREPATYYAGLTKVRLSKWEEAASILNQFIETYPDSSMLPGALYQGALSEFMLDRFEPALAKVDRVIAQFPEDPAVARSWNLKGDLLASDGATFEAVEECYLNGKETAGQFHGEEETAAYALWQLVIQTGEVEQWEKATAHIAEFEERHAGSAYRLDVLAASLPTLVATGRIDDALTRLRETVFEFGDRPESEELALMFGSYIDFLQSHLTPDDALAELESQREKALTLPALAGWFQVGIVTILGGFDETEPIREKIDQEYYRLNAGFDSAQHSNFVIAELARWTARHRNKPGEARELYRFILDQRPGTANYHDALVEMAILEGESDDTEQQAAALAKFEQVLREAPRDELSELAVLNTARILTRQKKWEAAQSQWEAYLEKREWTVSRPEANYEFARCLDEQGNTADALKIYVSVYANFPGHLDWSTRAYMRTALIMKDAGEDLKALLVLRDMLTRMGHLDHPVIDEAKKRFVQWRAEYTPEKSKAKGES